MRQLQQGAQRSSRRYTQTVKSEAFGAICDGIERIVELTAERYQTRFTFT